jgi:hypothetical protein
MRDQRDTGKTRIYISHHHSPYENDFTARLEADLSAARADVRTDDDSVTRDAFVQVMLESRATRQFFLVVITPDSVASPFVQREVSVALRERAAGRMVAVIPIFLLPTLLDEIPDPWRQLVSIDATQGYESAHQEVLSALGLTGPVLSDPLAASNPIGWRQSTPGAHQSDFPSQHPPVAGKRDSRAAADEPDTGPLPPFTRADEPDTGPLWPLPGAEPPAPPDAPPDAQAPADAMPAQQPAQPPSPPVAEPAPWPPLPPAMSSIPAETAAPNAPANSGHTSVPPAPVFPAQPGEFDQAPAAHPTPWYPNPLSGPDAPTLPDAPPDPFSNGPYHSPRETPPEAQQRPAEKATSPGAEWDAGGMRPPTSPRPDAGGPSDRRAQAATALERVAFTAYHPREVQRGRPAPLLVYLALDDAAALAQVAAQAAERLAGRLDQYRAGIADQRLTLRRGAKLRIIPTVPGFHVNPQWMDVTWDEDAQQHEFSIRADGAPSGHASEGAVRIYQGLTLRAEVPLSIFVSEGAGARLTPDAFASASARAYRRVFASYSHRDTPVVESCEAAAEAIGDRYLRDVMTLQSGQLWTSQLMKMISEADVFQLFWSKNASSSGYVRQEWEYALTLQTNRPGFIRPVYWSTAPFAIPPQLNPLHFEPLDLSALGWGPVRRFFYLMQS